MTSSWIFLYIVSFLKVIEAVQLIHSSSVSGNILCRNCGVEVTSNSEIFYKSSPHSQYSFNDTIFNTEEVQVQVFTTNLFFVYPVVQFIEAACEGDGEFLTLLLSSPKANQIDNG